MTSVQQQTARLDAELASAREAGTTAAEDSSVADMAAASAETLLRQRAAQAEEAAAALVRARDRDDDAELSLSLYAAELYQQGSASLGDLELVLGNGGVQAAMDRATGLAAVGDEHARLVVEAESAQHLAQSAAAASAEAHSRQDQAAAGARARQAEAAAAADRAQAESAALARRQQELTQQLATLQQTTTALEQQRQDGLAAQQEAARVDAARHAALAAAQQAAQQAQARAAAEQASAAAAQAAASSARAAAAAADAKQAADLGARQAAQQAAAQQPAPRPPAAPTTTTPPPPTGASGIPLNLANADMWERIAGCESGHNWHINTGNGYYGGLQFNLPTWLGVGGADFASRPDLASREQQITVANRLYAERGLQPWSCRSAA